jgi:hypothetical protein
MSTGNSHGDLLSGHKIGQACPGAPKTAKAHPISENSEDSTVVNSPEHLSDFHFRGLEILKVSLRALRPLRFKCKVWVEFWLVTDRAV